MLPGSATRSPEMGFRGSPVRIRPSRLSTLSQTTAPPAAEAPRLSWTLHGGRHPPTLLLRLTRTSEGCEKQ